MWIVLAFLSALFAGLTSILAKCGIRRTDSTVATAIRTVVVLIMAFCMTLIVGSTGQITSISPKSWIFLVLSGLATGGSWLCYFKALQLGDVNKVVPIDKSSTVLTIIFAAVFLREPVSWLGWLCVVGIAVGTYLMIEKKARTGGAKSRAWLVYAALSAVFAALTSILGKSASKTLSRISAQPFAPLLCCLPRGVWFWLRKKVLNSKRYRKKNSFLSVFPDLRRVDRGCATTKRLKTVLRRLSFLSTNSVFLLPSLFLIWFSAKN